jgi:hypothetical protein
VKLLEEKQLNKLWLYCSAGEIIVPVNQQLMIGGLIISEIAASANQTGLSVIT